MLMGTAQLFRSSVSAAYVAMVSVAAAAMAIMSPQPVPATKATKPMGNQVEPGGDEVVFERSCHAVVGQSDDGGGHHPEPDYPAPGPVLGPSQDRPFAEREGFTHVHEVMLPARARRAPGALVKHFLPPPPPGARRHFTRIPALTRSVTSSFWSDLAALPALWTLTVDEAPLHTSFSVPVRVE